MKKSNAVKRLVGSPEVNQLEVFLDLKEQAKLIDIKIEAIRKGLFAQMDARGEDELVIGKFKAVRAITIQERLDTARVKEFLGDKLPQFTTKVDQVRLTVI